MATRRDDARQLGGIFRMMLQLAFIQQFVAGDIVRAVITCFYPVLTGSLFSSVKHW